MIRHRRLLTLFLVLALGARILPLCDPAFAMPTMDAATPCATMDEPAHSPPAKANFKLLCLTGCLIAAVRASDTAAPPLPYAEPYKMVLVDRLHGMHHPPATPPPRLD